MNSINFENIACSQVRVDGELYELPYRVNSVIDFPDIIIFHSYPKEIDKKEHINAFNIEGRFSLYALSKKNKQVLWKMQNVVAVYPEIIQDKKKSDFVDKEHYIKYMKTFEGINLLTVFVGEFRKRIDANTGKEYSSMESR